MAEDANTNLNIYSAVNKYMMYEGIIVEFGYKYKNFLFDDPDRPGMKFTERVPLPQYMDGNLPCREFAGDVGVCRDDFFREQTEDEERLMGQILFTRKYVPDIKAAMMETEDYKSGKITTHDIMDIHDLRKLFFTKGAIREYTAKALDGRFDWLAYKDGSGYMPWKEAGLEFWSDYWNKANWQPADEAQFNRLKCLPERYTEEQD